MFLLLPAYPGRPGQTAVKWLLLLLFVPCRVELFRRKAGFSGTAPPPPLDDALFALEVIAVFDHDVDVLCVGVVVSVRLAGVRGAE